MIIVKRLKRGQQPQSGRGGMWEESSVWAREVPKSAYYIWKSKNNVFEIFSTFFSFFFFAAFECKDSIAVIMKKNTLNWK